MRPLLLAFAILVVIPTLVFAQIKFSNDATSAPTIYNPMPAPMAMPDVSSLGSCSTLNNGHLAKSGTNLCYCNGSAWRNLTGTIVQVLSINVSVAGSC